MHAAVIHAAKDLRLDERLVPRPSAGEVLAHFGAGRICGSDLFDWGKGRNGDFSRCEPLVLGYGVGGEIEASAKGVSHLAADRRRAIKVHLHF